MSEAGFGDRGAEEGGEGAPGRAFGSHSPVIVHTPEAGEDVSEAGVAIQLGLTLGPFDRAL